MILLKKIKLANFLSHEMTEIVFSDNEKTLLDGISGSGKSSIFDAIIWALYGKGRSDNRAIVKKGRKAGFVVLELIDGEKIYIIKRSASVSGKHTLEVSTQLGNGLPVAIPQSGLREIQAWIDSELIGASWLLFVNSVAYVQGNSESFVSQSAPKRKELLLEIIKADNYNKYYEKARETLSSLENEQNSVETEINVLRGILTPTEERIAGVLEVVTKINKYSIEDKELMAKITDLELKRDMYVNSMKDLVGIVANLKTVTENRNFIEKILLERKQDISEKEKILKIIDKAKENGEKLSKSRKELSQLRELLKESIEARSRFDDFMSKEPIVMYRTIEMARIEDKIKKIQSEPVCPSGDSCPYSGDHLKQIDELKAEVMSINEGINNDLEKKALWEKELSEIPVFVSVNDVLTKINDYEESIKLLEVAERQLNSLKKDLENIEGIEKKIPELEVTLENKQKEINDLEKRKVTAEKTAKPEELLAVDSKLKSEKENHKKIIEELAILSTKIKSIENDENDAKNMREKISILSDDLAVLTDNIKKVSLVKMAFNSKGGIETMVIDYLLPKLEDKINDILSKLSEFRVRLDTQKKSADGESIIEGLFITILNTSNEELPFEAYSGGEKLKISVAISEALATLQKVGFRLFDETFIGLDENSTESFAEVLDGLQKNFGQVLCISHLIQIKELFDKKIILTKNNNTSYVR